MAFSEYMNFKMDVPSIWMSQWHHTMVDGDEFWIDFQQLRILRKASHWQLIQNSAPFTIVWCKCDIWINEFASFLNYLHTLIYVPFFLHFSDIPTCPKIRYQLRMFHKRNFFGCWKIKFIFDTLKKEYVFELLWSANSYEIIGLTLKLIQWCCF